MKLRTIGKNISRVEVSNVSQFGIWLIVDEKEFFLSFAEYPWFKDARISHILNVKLINTLHLFWPDLDVDLEIDSLVNKESYPLVYH